ncbi:MAG: leucine-rich repeat domain-containing protein [Chloroflexota bacterium]
METAILSYLAKTFGPTLGRVLLATLLKQGNIDPTVYGADALADSLADSLDIGGLIARVTDKDRAAVRNANYLFDKIGDEAAEKLFSVFQQEGELAEAEWQNTIDAAKETLNRHALPLLIEQNLNAHDFRRALRNTSPAHSLETTDQEVLYNRLLDTCGQVVFTLADSIPDFNRDATAKILQNESLLLANMGTVLENQARILQKSYGQQKEEEDQQFESEYRTLLASSLDKLELFGVDTFDGTKQPLSVAYIRLMVEMYDRRDGVSRGDTPDHSPGEREMADRPSLGRHSLPVAQALSTGNRLLIVSDAGSGKTTLLKWLAVQTARYSLDPELNAWSGYVPFFIRLRDFANDPLPTIGSLATASRELATLDKSVPDNWSDQQLRQQKALLLVDGLDEVSNEKRAEATKWIQAILTLHAPTAIVVSSRPAGVTNQHLSQQMDQMGFSRIELLPMEPDQVTHFIEQWHDAMAHEHCQYLEKSRLPTRKESLLSALEKRDDLKKLAQSPILCAMLCALNLFELSELPQDRIRLYDRCISILLRRDENRQVDSSDYSESLRPDNARRRLARIAYWMMGNSPSTISHPDAMRLLEAEGLPATGVLEFLAARSVIFREQAVDEFDFIHRTFMEFLAAQEIVRSHEVKRVVQNHGTDSDWHETLRLLAGHVEPSDQATLLMALYDLSQSEPKERRALHFLAWDFWDLLDSRTGDALEAMIRHLRSLNLGGANLLFLFNMPIRDLSALAQLSNLQHLYLSYTQVQDVSHLAQLSNLQHLYLRSTQVQDVSHLAQLSNLQHLDLSYTHIQDVSHLAQLSNLQHLYLRSTQVQDVSTLREALPDLLIHS